MSDHVPLFPQSAPRVLIVEDDLAALFALKRLFQEHGWSIGASRTVTEAVAMLDSPPDWIVLDLALPDGNGDEILRHVRESGIPSRIAVLSGWPAVENLPQLEKLRPDVVLAKPIRFESLLRALEIPSAGLYSEAVPEDDEAPGR